MNESADVMLFSPAHMIELQDPYVRFTAVDAGVRLEVLVGKPSVTL
jgi:hypothetical protein